VRKKQKLRLNKEGDAIWNRCVLSSYLLGRKVMDLAQVVFAKEVSKTKKTPVLNTQEQKVLACKNTRVILGQIEYKLRNPFRPGNSSRV